MMARPIVTPRRWLYIVPVFSFVCFTLCLSFRVPASAPFVSSSLCMTPCCLLLCRRVADRLTNSAGQHTFPAHDAAENVAASRTDFAFCRPKRNQVHLRVGHYLRTSVASVPSAPPFDVLRSHHPHR
ncbi:hypothetical protein BC826DRAFT_1016307 [Russula brevipes]|nr:hypothetical protein BC826DRAFT_1016307 [Russula brevipes]